jgi:exodeoxyribonuclease VII large subunit
MTLYPREDEGLLTVSELTAELKRFVSGRFRDVRVEGEVSNAKLYPSGHFYFTLKDDLAMIRGVVFNYTARIPSGRVIRDGERVLCRGRIDVYEKRGEYQLIVSDILASGEQGLAYLRFLELKEKLVREGLFDETLKKPLPQFPRCIGIVTSPAGAAIRDMLRIIHERCGTVPVEVWPASVQGDDAAQEIMEGIEYFNMSGHVDVIIIGRGGGSYEDLACFNDEDLARTVFASRIPVVSAVGHEVDFTIADFVADVRAPTPTAAAALVVPDREELARHILGLKDSLCQGIERKLERARYMLVSNVMGFKDRRDFFTSQRFYLDDLTAGLTHNIRLYMKNARARFDTLSQRIHDLNPRAILARGYSITSRAGTGAVVTDSSAVSPGDALSITLHKGGLDVSVVDKKT